MCKICREEIEPGIETLDCSGCTELKEIPVISGLRVLVCSHCPGLTEIPIIRGLQTLNCWNCNGLTKIPIIHGLRELICFNCLNLTELPLIPGLQTIDCSYCSKLSNIPFIQGLRNLYCIDCRNLIELPYGSEDEIFIFIWSNGCLWMDFPSCRYDENIKKLILLQKWMKKMIVRKRLIKLIPLLMPIYYHPESKGGYFHKKNMLEFVESLTESKD